MRRQAAIMPDGRVGRIVLGGNKFHILVSESEIVERFLNQVGVFVADVPKLGGGNAHEQNFVAGMAVPRRLQPGVVGVPVHFFFQRIENARPRIWTDDRTGERHGLPDVAYQKIVYESVVVLNIDSAGVNIPGKTNQLEIMSSFV
jgi:hypothetical protein